MGTRPGHPGGTLVVINHFRSASGWLSRLERRMRRTYAAVRQHAAQSGMSWRTACYAIALERLQAAYHERGIWP